MHKYFSLILTLLFTGSFAQAASHQYVTWEGSEADKGASAWLIQAFVDPQAVFKTLKQGKIPSKGTPFDMPYAKYKRTHGLSTYEVILQDKKITDPTALYLGKIIRDLEINTWSQKLMPESPPLELAISRIKLQYGKQPVPLSCFIPFFKKVYSTLKTVHDNTTLVFLVPNTCKPPMK